MNLNSNLTKIFLFVLLVAVLTFGAYFALRNMAYFNVESIDIAYSGNVSGVSEEVKRIILQLKDTNILSINSSMLKNKLAKCGGVESVTVKKYYPGKIIVDVKYHDYVCKLYSRNEEGEIKLYLADNNKMVAAQAGTFNLYESLNIVELGPAYAQSVVQNGYDEGFVQMLELSAFQNSKFLLNSIKYDNNNKDKFGRLIFEFTKPAVQITVKEPVTLTRLNETMDFIYSEVGNSSKSYRYDLYSNTLIHRT